MLVVGDPIEGTSRDRTHGELEVWGGKVEVKNCGPISNLATLIPDVDVDVDVNVDVDVQSDTGFHVC